MAQVRIASCAVNFGADHAEFAVILGFHMMIVGGLKEARPSGPGFEFVFGVEEFEPTGSAEVLP